MPKLKYLLTRAVVSIFLILFVISFLFFLFRLIPGSYTNLMLLQGASEEAVNAFREQWGLNDPLYIQYARYMWNFVHLDVGTSLQYSKPVWEYVKMKIFNSFILVGPAITAAYLCGSAIGAILGTKRGSRLEQLSLFLLIGIGSFPVFFLGILLIIIFAGWLGWFPTSGMMDTQIIIEYSDAAWWKSYLSVNFAYHLVLPFTAIFLRYLYFPVLLMRTNVIEVKDQSFFHFNRMTGLSKNNRLRHLIKHASLPVITQYPISMTRAIGGLVLIETVFNWPGIGSALVSAILSRDLPVVQFVFFLIAIWIVFGNFIVDIVYGIVDPRVGFS